MEIKANREIDQPIERSRSILIEFSGLQGAGKSTLAREVAKELNLTPHPGFNPRSSNFTRRWLSRLFDLTKKPMITLSGMPLISRLYDLILLSRIARYELYKNIVATEHIQNCFIFEESSLHGAARIIDRKTPKHRISKLVSNLSLPDGIVFVETPAKTALERVYSREDSIDLNHVGYDIALKQLKDRRVVLGNILSLIDIPIVYIDGTKPTSENKAIVISFIKGLDLNDIE